MRRFAFALLALPLGVGCSLANLSDGHSSTDASSIDGAPLDASMMDVSMVDALVIDATLIDARPDANDASVIEDASDASIVINECADGGCKAVASNQATISGLAVLPFDDEITWVVGGNVYETSGRYTGTPTVTFPGSGGASNAVAIDGTYVFWSSTLMATGPQLLRSARLADSGPTVLADVIANSVASDSTYVYIVAADSRAYQIPRVGFDGGFNDGGRGDITPTNVGVPQSIAVDEQNAYILDNANHVIALSLPGLTPSVLGPPFLVDPTEPLFSDGVSVMWVSTSGVLQRYVATGSHVTNFTNDAPVRGFTSTGKLEASMQRVYWTEDPDVNGTSAAGTIHRANLDGTQSMTIATGLLHPTVIIAGGVYAYWIVSDGIGGQSIMRCLL